MLTKDLLVARRYRGRIYPRYADPRSPEHLRLAERVLEVFRSHLGKRRELLQRGLEGLELEAPGAPTAGAAKLVRGLAQLIERRCLFEPAVPAALRAGGIEPAELRRRLCRRGFVTSPQEREARLREVAEEFQREGIRVSPEELAGVIWADLEENQILRGFLADDRAGEGTGSRDGDEGEGPADAGGSIEDRPSAAEELELTPGELLRRYNLSLTQTLLFDALEVWFEVSGHYQAIFRRIKRLGLMYEAVEELPGQVKVRVDGPASLLKETTRYGTALAKLLPTLIQAPKFRLKARIKAKDRDGASSSPRHLIFELDHTSRGLFPSVTDFEGMTAADALFDSEVERDFYLRIRGVMRGWTVLREPTILKAGPQVFIPDFGFELKSGSGRESRSRSESEGGRVRYYLEIVGFWTPEYLKKKLAKLRAVDAPLLVAVDRALCCHEGLSSSLGALEEGGKEVFFYERRLPLKPVIDRLLELEEEQRRRDEALIEELGPEGLAKALEEAVSVHPQPDRLSLGELASRLGVGVRALREALAQVGTEPLEGYRLVGDELISEGLLARVRTELEALPPAPAPASAPASAAAPADAGDAGTRAEVRRGWQLDKVLEVLGRYGLGEGALEVLGYRIERESLLSARVVASNSKAPGGPNT